MANNVRDRWDKVEIAGKVIGSLFLPVIILIVGQQYTKEQKIADNAQLAQQQAAADAQHSADRATLLLTHLASEHARERRLALKFAVYFAQAHQFPEGLLDTIMSLVNDENQDVSHDASHALSEIIRLNPNLANSVQQLAQTNSDIQKTVVKAATLNPDLGRVLDLNKIKAATIR